MAGRPSKRDKIDNSSTQSDRDIEMAAIDEEMALRYYPDDEARRDDFLAFLRALRAGTPNPKSNTRAVHVYFYDEALKALYEGWNALVANRQIREGDSMSRVVGTMVTEYARLQKLEKAHHWEVMREKMNNKRTTLENPHIADPTTAAAASNDIEAEGNNHSPD